MLSGGELYQYQVEVNYADGSRSTSARRTFGVNRSSAIYITLTVSAFPFDSAVLDSSAKKALLEIAETLRKFPKEKIVVGGYSDNIGPAAYNIGLSRRRAEAVKTCLVQEGRISPDRFVLQWFGESRPLVRNDTPEGRKINRRAEVRGEFTETATVEMRTQDPTKPNVTINRSAVEVDSQGNFMTHVSAGPDGVEVQIRNAEGRSVHTHVMLPPD